MKSTINQKKWKIYSTWIVSAILALVFMMSGSMKIAAAPELVDNYARWGLPLWFLFLIGVSELLGALAILVPGLATMASIGLGTIMAGAIYTHVAAGDGPAFIIPLVLLGLLAFVGNIRRKNIFYKHWFGRERSNGQMRA